MHFCFMHHVLANDSFVTCTLFIELTHIDNVYIRNMISFLKKNNHFPLPNLFKITAKSQGGCIFPKKL